MDDRMIECPFFHPQQGRIDFNPSLPAGMDFLIHPCGWIDDEENVRTPPKVSHFGGARIQSMLFRINVLECSALDTYNVNQVRNKFQNIACP